MGIDWTAYLKGLQESTQGPESSLFPTSTWGNLSTLIKAAGVPQATDLSNKQQKMLSLLKNAQQFGLPAIRQLYSDTTFQQLAKDVGAALPQLPPLSSAELEESRTQAFLTEAEKVRKSKVTQPMSYGPGREAIGLTEERDLTAQELHKKYAALATQFPGEAEKAGLVQKIAPGTISTVLRGMLNDTTDPMHLLAAIDMLVYESGHDPSDIPDQLRTEIATLVAGPFAVARLQALQAQVLQRIAASNLSGAKQKDMEDSFTKRMALSQARIDEAIARKDHTAVLTEIAQINKEWLPTLNNLKAKQIEAKTSEIQAQRDYLKAHAAIQASYGSLNEARRQYYVSNYGSGLGGLKAREQALRLSITSGLKFLETLDKETPTTDTEIAAHDALRKSVLDGLAEDKTKLDNLYILETQLPISQPAPSTPPAGGAGGSVLPDNVQRGFNIITNNVKDAKLWGEAFNAARKNPKNKDWSPKDWNDLWYSLVQRAKEIKVDLPTKPPELK